MIILIFESTYDVLKCEKILKQNEIPYEVLPAPREYSSDCGMALKVEKGHLDKVNQLQEEINLNFKIAAS